MSRRAPNPFSSRTARRLRECAVPLLVILGLMVLALTPGMFAGDRPFEIALCGEHQGTEGGCAPLAAPAKQGG
jgi:hypothetical protein